MDDLCEVFTKYIIDLLEPFKEAMEKLEQDKQLTLPLVLLYNIKLQKHLAAAQKLSDTCCIKMEGNSISGKQVAP